MSRDPDARCSSCGIRLTRVDADHETRCIRAADAARDALYAERRAAGLCFYCGDGGRDRHATWCASTEALAARRAACHEAGAAAGTAGQEVAHAA